MAFTVQEMISGNNAIVVRNDSIWRAPVFGANWQRIRFGTFLHVPVTGDLTGFPRIYLGFCHAAGGGPLVQACEHFIGVRSNESSFSYFSGTGYAVSRIFNTATFQQRVLIENGAMSTESWVTVSPPNWMLGAINGSTPYRTATIIEAERTSPGNITMHLLRATSGSTTEVGMTNEQLFSAMESSESLSTIAAGLPTGYESRSCTEFAIDEATYGDIDAVAVGWNMTITPLLVGRVLVASSA